MNKNNGINTKILTGLLLLLLFILPYTAKNIHICRHVYIHDVDSDKNNDHHPVRHDCNSCAICQFVLSPFTEAASNEFGFTVKTVYSEPFIYKEYVSVPDICSYRLRAPPH
jgi:hypothetical protein